MIDFTHDNGHSYIQRGAQDDTADVDDQSISCGPQGVSHIGEKELEIFKSYKFTAEEAALIGIVFKCDINACHGDVGKQNQGNDSRDRKQIEEIPLSDFLPQALLFWRGAYFVFWCAVFS